MAAVSRLCIDAGQTGTRIRTRADGREQVGIRDGIRTDRPILDQLADLVGEVIASAGASVREIAIGSSGLTPAHADAGRLLTSLADLDVETVALTHDSVSAYLAANRLVFGVVTAVGTGVVTLGVGSAGVARVDGWGHLFGDAGSAYWIGRAGVEAALRDFDGRGPTTGLRSAAIQSFGPLDELYMAVQTAADRVSRVAAFATAVADHAEVGDAVAISIIDDAAAELAASALTALRRSGYRPGDPARMSWAGTVLDRNEHLRNAFADRITGRAPGVEIGPGLGEPLDGVELTLDLPAGHPLHTEVSYADRRSLSPR